MLARVGGGPAGLGLGDDLTPGLGVQQYVDPGAEALFQSGPDLGHDPLATTSGSAAGVVEMTQVGLGGIDHVVGAGCRRWRQP